MAINTKKWNGSSWVVAPVKKWNGSAWVDAVVRKWNGSSWEQMYPETVVNNSYTFGTSGFNTYRTSWDNSNDAKQGVYSSYAAAHGFIGISSLDIPGNGNIISVGSSEFSGRRNGSGYYNNNQTIHFYRSNVYSTSQSPKGTLVGEFTSTTGAPGKYMQMNLRTVNVNAELVNWLNGVGGKNNLFIYSASSSEYMGIDTSYYQNINNYKYQAVNVAFATRTAVSFAAMPSTVQSSNSHQSYHEMVVYKDEVGMTLSEILQRREDGIVQDIPLDNIDNAPDLFAWTREYEFFNDITETGETELGFRIEVMDMGMTDIPQYSLDGVTWERMVARPVEYETAFVSAILPKDFNKYSNTIYFRILNSETDSVTSERVIEPLIYIPDSGSIILPGEEIDIESILTPEDKAKYNQ